MPIVKNIIKDTQGAVVNGTATIELVIFDSSNNPQSFQGFIDIPADTTSDYTINIPASVVTSSGSWQATLRGNSDITDAYGNIVHTYYKISEAAQGVTRTYYIDVPVSGGPYWTGNIGAFNPSTFSASMNLNGLTDVDTTGKTDGQVLTYNSTTGLWVPATISSEASGSWTPTGGGGGTQPGTWLGSWDKLGSKTYQVSVSCLITGTWSGAGTLTASLPGSWARHANQAMHLNGALVTNAATPVYYEIGGIVDPISISNSAPTIKFITPSSTFIGTTYDWKLVNGVSQPVNFFNGYRLDVSGVVKIG